MPRQQPDFTEITITNIMSDGTVLDDIKDAEPDPDKMPPVVKRIVAEMLKKDPPAQ